MPRPELKLLLPLFPEVEPLLLLPLPELRAALPLPLPDFEECVDPLPELEERLLPEELRPLPEELRLPPELELRDEEEE